MFPVIQFLLLDILIEYICVYRFLPGLTGNNNCPPSTYSNGFNNGYSVHNNGYNVPNNGYNVPNNGYNVPNNGYGYNQGYNGINQGYNVPNVGYNAHAQGYQQPGLNSGYSSPQQIHITAQQGYNNGYNTQTGYNSPQTGYNSPQLGYNQHQNGYNQGYNQNFQPTGYPPVPNSGYNSGFVSAGNSLKKRLIINNIFRIGFLDYKKCSFLEESSLCHKLKCSNPYIFAT